MKIKIPNSVCISILTELNGAAPVNYFVVKNKSKDKKATRAYIFNETETTYQLVPVKKNGKEISFDKENIVTLSKTDDIKKCILLVEDTHDHFYIYLNNGFTYKFVIHKSQFDKFRKKIYVAFRKQFREQSMFQQTMDIAFCIIIAVLIGCLTAFGTIYASAYYDSAVEVRQMVEDEQYAERLSVILEPYDKADLKLDGDFITVQHGPIKMNIPNECYLKEDYNANNVVIYTNGAEPGASALNIFVTYESITDDTLKDSILGMDYEDLETREKKYNKISKAGEKEFGFPIDNYYHYTKAMWMMDASNINYFNRGELALYSMLYIQKIGSTPGECKNVYDIKTDSYSGFIRVCGPYSDKTDVCMVTLSVYPNSNPDFWYEVQVVTSDLEQAFKILNSVELVETEK